MKNLEFRIVKWFALLAVLLLQSVAFSQQPTATATLDSNLILIGEQINLTLQLTCQAQDSVVWPTIGDTLKKEIEVVQKSKVDTTFDSENNFIKTLSQQLTLTSFDSGYWAVPPIQFLVNGETVETEVQLLAVQTVPVDTANKIYDIKGPLSVHYTWADWLRTNWQWLAGGALLGAIIALIIYLLKNRKEKPAPVIEKPKPKIPPHIIALEKLDKLKEKKLWQAGKTKEYHSKMSEIVREYLENRFYVNALEQTTYEILHNLRTVDISEENKAKLEQLLMLSDLVKFAKEKPIASENEQVLQHAYDFVNNTIPKLQEPEKQEKTEAIEV